MNVTRLLLALVAAIVVIPTATAQDYPAKAIRLVVPFPPGGGTDIFSREIAHKLSDTLKWVVVVDNKPGAGGNIGMDAVAKAPADGYTIGMGQTSNLAINPTLYAKLPYDPLKDLAPIALVADAPLVLVVPANSPFRSVADLVAAAKKKPGEVTFGSPGNGTVAHLTGELFQTAAGIKLSHIPYKGSAQAITDLMGGQVQSYMSSIPTALSHIKGGKLRALAVTSTKRVPTLPDVPTIAEAGYKGFDATTWFGIVAPAGTAPAIINKLNAEVNRVLKAPDLRDKFAAEGGGALGSSPQEFAAMLKSDYAKWGKVVKDANIKLD
ncbi:MAG TPA: tripartite tricarboxylate transporter substrate binding protein [Burkholderiales bacterium]|nr:tripartite tricarboxylate transporter substrate binding protein [Burkholderiales bacterium]